VSDGIQISQTKQTLWVVAFMVAAALIAALGYFFYRAEEERVRSERAQELTAIGTLKAGQIAEWRKERRSDAIRFAQGPTLTRALEKNDPEDLRIMMNLNRKAFFYEDTLLVSPSYRILSSAVTNTAPLAEASRWAVDQAITTGVPALSDFYQHGDDAVHIDIAAPVNNDNNQTVAAFILRCAASDFLYPLIQSWPVPSLTAETLLVRRQGDMVIFLNKLRHERHSAMTLKLPVTRTDVPAVQAVLGKQGVVKGVDYRGTPVLADIRPVPDSDWFIVSKVDSSEVLAHVRAHALIISGFVLLGLLLAAAATAFGFRNRQASLYRNRYRVEREQRLSSEKYRTILYSIGDGVITTDEQACVQQMNPVAESLTGWTEAEARGRTLEEVFRIINEETRRPVNNPAWHVLRENKIVGIANHTVLVARDGKEYPITDSGAPIRDESENIVGVVIVFRDQSAERVAQKALFESERRLSTLMNNLPGMVYRCRMDTYWTMEFVSQGCTALTGFRAAELLDNKQVAYFDLLHPEDRQRVWDTIAAAVEKRETFTLEYRIVAADGKEKWVWERGCPVLNEAGSVDALEGFIHDVTERKLASSEQANLQEQLHQSQKIEAVGRLAGGVAHDFNNMLAVIIGNAELAKDHLPPGSPVYAELQEVIKAGMHSAYFVKQLLGFASKQTIKPRQLCLNDAIGSLCDMIRRLIGEAIALEWIPGADLWPVLMDPRQLDQILVNMAVNSRDAIAGVGKIVIETRNVSHSKAYDGLPAHAPVGHYVMISFKDNGCGMDAATQAQIFEPFFTTKPHGFGTGLGLSTVYGVVKQNNGFIQVSSQPGKGACFRIYLPRFYARNTRTEELLGEAEAPSLPSQAPAALPTETILLVEDESAVLNLTLSLLKKMGYHVLAANGPEDALRISREHEGVIHLLLTDVVMPKMSGRDLWQQLLLERPGLKCLFMSGYTANIIARHGVIDEDLHFLQKPFSREALAGKVRETLSAPLITSTL